VIIRNADGAVGHDGEFSPRIELDAKKEKECEGT
jgi:hypothetical protein